MRGFGEALGDVVGFVGVERLDLVTRFEMDLVDGDSIDLRRLPRLAGFKEFPPSAIAEVVVEETIEVGVSGSVVATTESAASNNGAGTTGSGSAM